MIREIAPVMEDRGVDEVYIDFTEVPGGQREGGRVLARLIQKLDLRRHRPHLLDRRRAQQAASPRWRASSTSPTASRSCTRTTCRRASGRCPRARSTASGPRPTRSCKRFGIRTIGELAARERDWLIENFGKATGAWMHEVAWGRDERPVVTESEPVSMSRETTFERDLHAVRDRAELGAIFTHLCEKLAEDLQRKGYVGKTIGIKLRYDDFKIATRDQTIDQFTADAKTIRQTAGQCLKRVPLERPLRLLGVRVGALAKAGSPEALLAPAHGGSAGQSRAAAELATTASLF